VLPQILPPQRDLSEIVEVEPRADITLADDDQVIVRAAAFVKLENFEAVREHRPEHSAAVIVHATLGLLPGEIIGERDGQKRATFEAEDDDEGAAIGVNRVGHFPFRAGQEFSVLVAVVTR
jgi:hypothetical protein